VAENAKSGVLETIKVILQALAIALSSARCSSAVQYSFGPR
jgi:hypothetical protein